MAAEFWYNSKTLLPEDLIKTRLRERNFQTAWVGVIEEIVIKGSEATLAEKRLVLLFGNDTHPTPAGPSIIGHLVSSVQLPTPQKSELAHQNLNRFAMASHSTPSNSDSDNPRVPVYFTRSPVMMISSVNP